MAVVAGALLDPGYRSGLSGSDAGQAWFSQEQLRVHATVNRVWPRALGTTPMGVARALTVHSRDRGVRYRWRLWRGRRDRLADVLDAVAMDWPVPMLIGRWIPRHWVLIVDATVDGLRCYEPASGQVRTVGVEAIRGAQLSALGYPWPFAFVVPSCATRAATL
ncbi:hypothetical protein NGTWS0302_04350 [Mycolicibacterium cyprinidarum]|uniref:Peptidase C39-like domain-containing protein n=1 Tax=Mycolicibacterium cyprinidarum TaxID=2860311 RepID=A0ABQ4V4W1_9MYCO|nr:hypothetical protein NGTWS1702_04690 [Mycolicibacterium sp. NGTWSNA01]GJF13462.1 hypothetical protein NGTWS0302_04350 [Mycolicibacterium sp. NGTWS0302]